MTVITGLMIQQGATVFHPASGADGTGRLEQVVAEGRFARVAMAHERYGPGAP